MTPCAPASSAATDETVVRHRLQAFDGREATLRALIALEKATFRKADSWAGTSSRSCTPGASRKGRCRARTRIVTVSRRPHHAAVALQMSWRPCSRSAM